MQSPTRTAGAPRAASAADGQRARRHHILEEDLHAFLRPKQAREAFLFLDRDRSGRLTLHEVNEAVAAVFQCAAAPPTPAHVLPPCKQPSMLVLGRVRLPLGVLQWGTLRLLPCLCCTG